MVKLVLLVVAVTTFITASSRPTKESGLEMLDIKISFNGTSFDLELSENDESRGETADGSGTQDTPSVGGMTAPSFSPMSSRSATASSPGFSSFPNVSVNGSSISSQITGSRISSGVTEPQSSQSSSLSQSILATTVPGTPSVSSLISAMSSITPQSGMASNSGILSPTTASKLKSDVCEIQSTLTTTRHQLLAARKRAGRAQRSLRNLKEKYNNLQTWRPTEHGEYTAKARELARGLIHAGCAAGKVELAVKFCAKAFGIVIWRNRFMSRPTVSRAIDEGGKYGEIQLGMEIMNGEVLMVLRTAHIRKKRDEYVALHSPNNRGNLVDKSPFT
ncbi:hypothetical protein B0H14DRAFT_2585325 [Mycena olivaceomarginata]|nr:hypothetical protein B0H14DRAFT_2635270 [Mycena olivaceomarginata]KAJ7844266.1 hypothetical protein B0H14DRAFT_2585325 [Mycena olivaceomarginata]